MMLKKRHGEYIAFILPALVFISIMLGYPFFSMVKLSLFQYNHANPRIPTIFIGLENYHRLLRDEVFRTVLKNSLFFTAGAVGGEFLIGLGLALLLNSLPKKGRSIIIGLLLLPMIMVPAVVGQIWRYTYNHEFGLVSWYLKEMGLLGPGTLLGRQAILINRFTVLPAIILTDIWEWTPFVALVLLAGLIALPKDPFEAAKIDGATRWQIFRYVTLPLLIPCVSVGLLIRLIDAIKVFDIIYIITAGGPGVLTETISFYAYKVNFKQFNMGYGAAVVVALVIIVLLICVLLFKLVERGAPSGR